MLSLKSLLESHRYSFFMTCGLKANKTYEHFVNKHLTQTTQIIEFPEEIWIFPSASSQGKAFGGHSWFKKAPSECTGCMRWSSRKLSEIKDLLSQVLPPAMSNRKCIKKTKNTLTTCSSESSAATKMILEVLNYVFFPEYALSYFFETF